ncbi:MAG: hypothetical protein HY223_05650 [Thaumarchaeota archaeon]|nr:hypothetical protein [Nitrososphaerota archaeon]
MRSRKGLSSIVGTVFAIIALSTTVGYITYSMNVLDKYNQSVLVTNADALDRNKEQIQVTGVTIDNNKFNITANDNGNLPVHLTRFWVTNTTDVNKVFKYNIDYNLAPGQSQIKIGQSLPIYAKTNQAYDLKLITERGNVKEFAVNSAGTAPLNIQLLALPPTVASGFKTQLVMTVTNNGTGTLTNLVPVLTPNGSPTATCTPDPISSPTNYNTLAPGSTAIFSWAVKVTGTADGQTCKFGAQLQNGYNKNFGNATITENLVLITSTTYAQNTGILTLDYTSLRWSVGTSWKTGWGPTGSSNVAFYLNMTNNNQTSGVASTLYIQKNSLLYTSPTTGGASSQPYYIVQNVTKTLSATAFSCTGPPVDDYCISVPPGKSIILQFYSTTVGGNTQPGSSKLPGAGTALALNLIIFGKFASCQNCAGSEYGQLLPYNGILTS